MTCMDVNKAVAQARSKLAEVGLLEWDVSLRRFKTTGGQTYFDERVIGFGPELIKLWTPKQFQQVLSHEVAHAIVGFEHGHDHVWLNTARELGYHGGVTHDFPTVPGRWILYCGECGELERTHSRPRKTHYCIECESPIAILDARTEDNHRALTQDQSP